jgi:phosphoserine phosphatase
MLSSVGNPIAFNPNDALAAHAKKYGWKIIVERKNVIYDLKNFNFLQKNENRP